MSLVNDQPSLLIIEDDLDVADMLNAYFRIQGYEVTTVNWGRDAIRACEGFLPDLIISDIILPDLNGFEVARRLRTNRLTKNIPIIFLTEKTERQDRLAGLELGADDYITKPFDIQELRLRVRNSLIRAKQTMLRNPVTDLPESRLVDERMQQMLTEDHWAVMIISLQNLDYFRDEYGFIAADDVLRAISLMIDTTVKEVGVPSDFLGHLSATVFVLITIPEIATQLRKRLYARLRQSLDYFYPMRSREQDTGRLKSIYVNRLAVKLGVVRKEDGLFEDISLLKKKLQEQIQK
jgi:DNA-binding response OmpR family regulator